MKPISNTPLAIIRIPVDRMELELLRVLRSHGFPPEKAKLCAQIFTENTRDGVATHGVNRFPRFIQDIQNGTIHIHAEPTNQQRAGAIEQWDGHGGPGILNAIICTERAIELAKECGMGCVALRNTNHWMRGGTYAWKAAAAGFFFIGWTNTTANMPAWGALDCRLGNNPFVMGVPYQGDAIVMDMAMSQFSYGTMEQHGMRGAQLSIPGGYDSEGTLTTDPKKILHSRRVLPIGYWKGSGLALLLDILATVLSGGLSTAEISSHDIETAVSQIFLVIDVSKLATSSQLEQTLNAIVIDFKKSKPESGLQEILYPGERVMRVRAENLQKGIPVDKSIWEKIQTL